MEKDTRNKLPKVALDESYDVSLLINDELVYRDCHLNLIKVLDILDEHGIIKFIRMLH